MRWILVASLLTLIGGCSFDGTGVSGAPADAAAPEDAAAVDAPRDAAAPGPDGENADSGTTPDMAVDQGTADQGMAADQGVVVTPVSGTALREAYAAARVQCIDADGTPRSWDMPIVDRNGVHLADGADVLWDLPADLQAWIGDRPTVVVVYDPNACDQEDQGDGDWRDAGLIVRGATLDSHGDLVLPPDATLEDIDIEDVYADGRHEAAFGGPGDSNIPVQLQKPILEAKMMILQLAGL